MQNFIIRLVLETIERLLCNNERSFLTFGHPSNGVRHTLLLGELYQVALAVDTPCGHSARVQTHVDLLHRNESESILDMFQENENKEVGEESGPQFKFFIFKGSLKQGWKKIICILDLYFMSNKPLIYLYYFSLL